MIRSICFTAALLVTSATSAQDDEVAKFIDKLNFRTGDIAIAEAGATLRLTPAFRYLGSADAEKVLTELWGNPPGSDAIGMLVPTSVSLADDASWAVVITYSDDGHISDEEASDVDYDEILADMQEATRDNNDERERAGYGRVDLVGWAQKPHYDSTSKKIYWAKHLKFGDSDTLNYDIRVLGREGYLSLNAVANMDSLPQVEKDMQDVLAMTEFDAGRRYADFNENTDKLAGYGLAALVGGAVAAKAGLFAKLGALLIAGKKFIIFILAGIVALFRKMFGKKDKVA